MKKENDNLTRQDFGIAQEDGVVFEDTLQKCVSNMCGMRLVGECKRKDYEWWSEEVRVTVTKKRRTFQEWLLKKIANAYSQKREKGIEVKRFVNKMKLNAGARRKDGFAKLLRRT